MAITKDPEYAWGYFDLARVLCAKGDFPRAADAIRQALVVDSQLRVAMRGDGEFTKLCKPVLATLTSG